jgi:hypothetical protein
MRFISLLHHVQTCSGAHSASYYSIKTTFPAINRCCVELYLHSPNTSSWCGVKLCPSEWHWKRVFRLSMILAWCIHGIVIWREQFIFCVQEGWAHSALFTTVILNRSDEKVQDRVHKGPPLDPTLSQVNPVHTLAHWSVSLTLFMLFLVVSPFKDF